MWVIGKLKVERSTCAVGDVFVGMWRSCDVHLCPRSILEPKRIQKEFDGDLLYDRVLRRSP